MAEMNWNEAHRCVSQYIAKNCPPEQLIAAIVHGSLGSQPDNYRPGISTLDLFLILEGHGVEVKSDQGIQTTLCGISDFFQGVNHGSTILFNVVCAGKVLQMSQAHYELKDLFSKMKSGELKADADDLVRRTHHCLGERLTKAFSAYLRLDDPLPVLHNCERALFAMGSLHCAKTQKSVPVYLPDIRNEVRNLDDICPGFESLFQQTQDGFDNLLETKTGDFKDAATNPVGQVLLATEQFFYTFYSLYSRRFFFDDEYMQPRFVRFLELFADLAQTGLIGNVSNMYVKFLPLTQQIRFVDHNNRIRELTHYPNMRENARAIGYSPEQLLAKIKESKDRKKTPEA